jgi:outer membrane protein assembly factor BamB
MRNSFAATAAPGSFALAAMMALVQSGLAAASGSQAEYAVAYQINPAHSGNINFSAGFSAPLTQVWSVNLGSLLSYPVIAEDKVFVNGSNGETFALDLNTGSTKWSKFTGATLGPAYDHGSLFLLDPDAFLSALSAKSGKSLWETHLTEQLDADSAPMAHNGQVFAAGSYNSMEGGGDLYGVDETSGAVNWYRPVENGDDSSPAYGDDGVYVTYDCQYYKFGTYGGMDWNDNYGCDGGGGYTPVFYGNRVYIQDSSGGGHDYILDADTGVSIGKLYPANIGDPPAFWQFSKRKSLGFSLYDGYLYGWNVSAVRNVWSFAGDGELSTPPIVINGLVVEGSGSGNVYVLDAGTGTQEWSGSTGAGVTALSAGQGTLVVISGSIVTAYKPG